MTIAFKDMMVGFGWFGSYSSVADRKKAGSRCYAITGMAVWSKRIKARFNGLILDQREAIAETSIVSPFLFRKA